MSVTVYSYKTIDIEKIKSSLPKKSNNKYSSFIVYYNDPLFIQTPKMKLTSITDDSSYIFDITEFPDFIQVIENIEIRIKHLIFNNSTKWFDGKQFSKSCIDSRLESLLIKDSNKVFLTVPFESKNVSFFNQYKSIIEKKELELDSILTCILSFPVVSFTESKFQCSLVLEQGKIYQDKFLTDYSIIDSDDNSEVSDIETVEDEQDCHTFIPSEIEDQPFF